MDEDRWNEYVRESCRHKKDYFRILRVPFAILVLGTNKSSELEKLNDNLKIIYSKHEPSLFSIIPPAQELLKNVPKEKRGSNAYLLILCDFLYRKYKSLSENDYEGNTQLKNIQSTLLQLEEASFKAIERIFRQIEYYKALISPDLIKTHHKIKCEEGMNKRWEANRSLYQEAVDKADKLWEEGYDYLHHEMAEHLINLGPNSKLSLKTLTRKLKPVAEKYNRKFGVKGIKK